MTGGMNRKALDLTEMKDVRAELRFRDLGIAGQYTSDAVETNTTLP
jgi:hypothetical protein